MIKQFKPSLNQKISFTFLIFISVNLFLCLVSSGILFKIRSEIKQTTTVLMPTLSLENKLNFLLQKHWYTFNKLTIKENRVLEKEILYLINQAKESTREAYLENYDTYLKKLIFNY